MSVQHRAGRSSFAGWLASPSGVAFLVLAGIALAFLLYEHRVHALGVLPYLLLVACPLVHLFHHRGHGGHGHDDGSAHSHQPPRPRDDPP